MCLTCDINVNAKLNWLRSLAFRIPICQEAPRCCSPPWPWSYKLLFILFVFFLGSKRVRNWNSGTGALSCNIYNSISANQSFPSKVNDKRYFVAGNLLKIWSIISWEPCPLQNLHRNNSDIPFQIFCLIEPLSWRPNSAVSHKFRLYSKDIQSYFPLGNIYI